jgi:hypothetical protein
MFSRCLDSPVPSASGASITKSLYHITRLIVAQQFLGHDRWLPSAMETRLVQRAMRFSID